MLWSYLWVVSQQEGETFETLLVYEMQFEAEERSENFQKNK